MNTNPNAKVVLCYGDSNTWGQNPVNGTRYSVDVRWTGVAQKMLGDGYYLIEEGLSGRTTQYSDTESMQKNGMTFLPVCLNTHKPIDLIIIFLGTNDLKSTYRVAKENIGHGIETLINVVNEAHVGNDGIDPKILIIAPPKIKDVANKDIRMKEGPEKSQEFARAYIEVADAKSCYFIDSAVHIESSDIDGYHLDENSHKILGEAVAEKIKTIL